MRIDNLNLRTMKEDPTKDQKSVEVLLERAGFLRKVAGQVFDHPLGLLQRQRIYAPILDVLYKEGFSPFSSSGHKTVQELLEDLHDYVDAVVSSYKDLPLKIFGEESVRCQQRTYESLFKTTTQKMLHFSVLGETKQESMERMERVLCEIPMEIKRDGDAFYVSSEEGEQRFSLKSPQGKHEKDSLRVEGERKELRKIHTPETTTIQGLANFLSTSKEDILKTMLYTDGEKNYAVLVEGGKEVDIHRVTRVLGLQEDVLRALTKDEVEKLTGAPVGFAGPYGLKVDRLLVDDSVKKDKSYVTGANEKDYHYEGVYYGRHFSGDFHDLTLGESEQGWLIGEVRTHERKIRVQSAKGIYDFVEITSSYIYLDRLYYSFMKGCMDPQGFSLPVKFTPFTHVVTVVDARAEASMVLAEEAYEKLMEKGCRVLLDPRRDRLGSKFYDYDLLGIPYRILVGRTGTFEVKNRQGVLLHEGLAAQVVDILAQEVVE